MFGFAFPWVFFDCSTDFIQECVFSSLVDVMMSVWIWSSVRSRMCFLFSFSSAVKVLRYKSLMFKRVRIMKVNNENGILGSIAMGREMILWIEFECSLHGHRCYCLWQGDSNNNSPLFFKNIELLCALWINIFSLRDSNLFLSYINRANIKDGFRKDH